MQKYFLSVDIGTSSLKVALFDKDAVLLSYVSKKFSNSALAYKEWISCFFSCVEELQCKYVYHRNTVDTALSPQELKPHLYISISGQGPSIVYLNDKDEIIFYSQWNSKNKVSLEGSSSYFLPYVKYVQKHMPEIFSDVQKILAPAEYLIYKLCGKSVMCIPHHKYISYVWAESDIRRYELPSSLFPRTVISGSLIGESVTDFARNFFPYFGKIFIVAGGLDYLSALIGSGIDKDAGFVLQRSGTSVVINAIADAIDTCDEMSESRYQRFIVPHFFQDKTNIGYSIPFYNDLHTLFQEYIRTMQCTSADMIKFCAQMNADFVVKKLASCVYGKMPAEALKNVFYHHGISNLYEKAGYVLMTLLREVETIYKQVVHNANLSFENTKMLAVSGGHATDTMLMELYAYFLGKTIRCFSPVFCELRGNLALARFAAKEHANIQDAIQHVHISLPFCDYKIPKI